jgi:hypothetical protein
MSMLLRDFGITSRGHMVQLPTGPYLHVPRAAEPTEPVTGASIRAFMDEVYRRGHGGMAFEVDMSCGCQGLGHCFRYPVV